MFACQSKAQSRAKTTMLVEFGLERDFNLNGTRFHILAATRRWTVMYPRAPNMFRQKKVIIAGAIWELKRAYRTAPNQYTELMALDTRTQRALSW